jgi:dTMP kinase
MSLFITFEGGEGSGKSTQAEALKQRLEKLDINVMLTHEPGGTPLGDDIRAWLKGDSKAAKGKGKKSTSQKADIDPGAELLLFNAARAQLVSRVIRPALDSGAVVICDRFYHSTIAYQGHGRGLDLDLINRVNNIATAGLKPNLTILLDIDAKLGLSRKKLQDRFEREDIEFHKRVRQGYLGMSQKEPQRWLVINAAQAKDEIERQIWQWVEQLMPAMRRGEKITRP